MSAVLAVSDCSTAGVARSCAVAMTTSEAGKRRGNGDDDCASGSIAGRDAPGLWPHPSINATQGARAATQPTKVVRSIAFPVFESVFGRAQPRSVVRRMRYFSDRPGAPGLPREFARKHTTGLRMRPENRQRAKSRCAGRPYLCCNRHLRCRPPARRGLGSRQTQGACAVELLARQANTHQIVRVKHPTSDCGPAFALNAGQHSRPGCPCCSRPRGR